MKNSFNYSTEVRLRKKSHSKSKPVKHDFNKNRDDSKWSDPNDLSKPAIWSKTQFDRGINLE